MCLNKRRVESPLKRLSTTTMTEHECEDCGEVFPTPREKRRHAYQSHKRTSKRICEVCYRLIADLAHDREDVFRFSLEQMSSPDDRTSVRGGFLCGPCAEEMLELTDEIATIDPDSDIVAPGSKKWWTYSDCGFCGDLLEKSRGGLYHAWGPPFSGETFHMLCTDCVDIVTTFIDNLPEEQREGEWFRGRFEDDIIKTSVDETDFDAIREVFKAIEGGEEVHLESHRSTTEHYPDEYADVDGTVLDENSVGGSGPLS